METLTHDAGSVAVQRIAAASVHGLTSSRAAGPDLLRALGIAAFKAFKPDQWRR